MDSGAWRSIDELEDSLTLEELYFFHEGVQKRSYEALRNMCAAQGHELPPWNVAIKDDTGEIRGAEDVAMLPFGLGYSRED